MSVEIKGMDEVLAKLDQQLGTRKVNAYSKEALTIMGRYLAVQIKNAVASYRNTGATVQEIVVSTPRKKDGTLTVKIGWDGMGSRQRWRLVHLNEFGYTRSGRTYRPRGIGKIQKAYDSNKVQAKELGQNQLRKLVN
ncbi:hypothetical protein FC71_GL001050 [Latilactobacillus sakei subsp. carnosus DSM 15831]|uniref:hypothetical protein n=1 Tax=Latilactobacillus sakei TaxID=1599 RepID=UPI00019CED40|nr:hypothetical protein [Latilactobacillus sakei]KRL69612.1 hypothetical protein FC71_GL001050 [Latilactobacillus sakei subsp. carnosus DSM 15831]MCP8851755.1 hypothetical protein [Latilactobacillus sakei]MCP8855237.1 hypothetical protein [Latilactobacillus sakei]GEP21109.1 hypothetical protein LSA03nite_06970 [Latilactobacillus sakei subsp. carnosus]